MSAWLPKVVEPSKQQVLAAVFFLILYPYYLIRESDPHIVTVIHGHLVVCWEIAGEVKLLLDFGLL